MSGCVNCVWDAYREEVEEWVRGRRRRGEGGGGVEASGGRGDGEEGGRGERGGGVEDEGVFEGVPVGIREFMRLEKRIREGRDEGRGKG